LCFPRGAVLGCSIPSPSQSGCSHSASFHRAQFLCQLPEPVTSCWFPSPELPSGSFSPQLPRKHPARRKRREAERSPRCPWGCRERRAPAQPGQLSSLSCQLQLSCGQQWEGLNSCRNNESLSKIRGVRMQMSLLCFVLSLLSWAS